MEECTWVINHWGELTLIVTGVISIASVITKLTPTEVDNKFVALILKSVELLALNSKPIELKK